MNKRKWKLNTSNQGKFKEFQRLFTAHGEDLEATHIDLKEIDASEIEVVAHKASQLEENTLVEDTSLHIEGASVGVNVRWLLDHLSDYIGRRAEWTVLLAVHQDSLVQIYKGTIFGTIVEARGNNGFGFDPVFLPDGSSYTLAESKSDETNARAQAVEALLKGDVWTSHPVIKNWDGPWQKQ